MKTHKTKTNIRDVVLIWRLQIEKIQRTEQRIDKYTLSLRFDFKLFDLVNSSLSRFL